MRQRSLFDRIMAIPPMRRLRIARILSWTAVSMLAVIICLFLWHLPGGQDVSAEHTLVRTELTEAEKTAASALAETINRTWNVKIRYTGDPSKFVQHLDGIPDSIPNTWRLESAVANDVVPALRAINAALSVYPIDFVRKYMGHDIGTIFLVRSLVVNGYSSSGMIFSGAIYVGMRDAANSGIAAFDADTLHHEFALFALYDGPSPKARWAAVNPSDFAYATEHDADVVREIGHRPDAQDTSDAVRELGFMEKWAESSLEEDWQTYAEQAFGHPADLVGLVKRFPRIKAKTRIFIDHYVSLDPAFKAYFERTGLSKAVE
ncbi:hypothetical protein [Telmatospirillum sp.]|uniref:hypothetical protein n=1 Tax=Telmatospirillum sp. TaxID=2079197 RepID=UPI0028492967|nr:hypothetical protein [Telmatospirillum sp.]MDR3435252.1 hypothetical protein [Telmatospirillum sp.]